VKANRISQELMDDAKEKATSMKFEQIRILSESYHSCKDQGNFDRSRRGDCGGQEKVSHTSTLTPYSIYPLLDANFK
jgi:hypothetical protein